MSETRDESVAAALPTAPAARLLPHRVTWQKLVVVPGFLVALLLATWLSYTHADLDPVSRSALGGGNVWLRFSGHVRLTVISSVFALAIAVPLGILLTRPGARRAAPLLTACANIWRATPAIGLLALLVIWLGADEWAALAGITLYAVLPVLSGTVARLKADEPTPLEGLAVVPLVLAGARTALVLNVGTATLAAFAGGGGLGDLIATGITEQRMPVLVLGCVLTMALALFVDWLASIAELLLRPREPEAGR